MTSVWVSRSANRRRMRSRSASACRSAIRLAWPRTISCRLASSAPRPGGEAGVDQPRRERVEFAARRFARPRDFLARFRQRAAADLGVEVVGRLGERRSRHAGGRRDDAVLDRAVLADQHRQRPLGIEADELDMLEADIVLRGDDDAGAVGQVGEQGGRLGQRAFEAAFLGGGAHLAVDSRPLLARQAAELEQRVDVKAQAELGRQAAGAGVRRVDEAELLEILHHVAHRGGRQRDRQHAREVARADRLAAGEIGVDDAAEDLARPRVEVGEDARFGGRGFGGSGHGGREGDAPLARKGRGPQGASAFRANTDRVRLFPTFGAAEGYRWPRLENAVCGDS